MNKKIIDYIQSEVTSLARQKYPDNERMQWIYVYGFISAQLAMACEYDNITLYRFKQAVRAVESVD